MKRKQPLSVDFANTPGLAGAFLRALELKQLYRQGWLHRGLPPARCESVAEHSFGVAMLAALIASAHRPDLSLERVLLLALIHDLGEVEAGDRVPDESLSPDEKKALEKASLKNTLGKMPGNSWIADLWEEYEAQVSPEAQFVREMDRLEMAAQALIYEKEAGLSADEFFSSAAASLHSDAAQHFIDALSHERSSG